MEQEKKVNPLVEDRISWVAINKNKNEAAVVKTEYVLSGTDPSGLQTDLFCSVGIR